MEMEKSRTKIKTKMAKIAMILILLFVYTAGSAQHRNIHEMVGKDNPYGYVVTGDSVELYKMDSLGWKMYEKTPFNSKILSDLRVLNRNQTRIENWILVLIGLNLLSLAFLIFKRKKE